ncbi:MAG TPA: DNA-3-methyladenine glycosylase [bacterium]|nr:DNA-3-methyladenine glycosylase [bacterium]
MSRREDRPGAVTTLGLPALFSVTRTLAFLRHSSLRTPYHFVDARRVRRVVRVDGRALLVDFAFPVRGKAEVRVCVLRDAAARGGRQVERSRVVPALRRLAADVWSLADDLRCCYRLLGADPVMAPLVRQCRGLRNVRTPNLYEALAIAILNQQISVGAAESIRRRFFAALGDRLAWAGTTYVGFPSPRRLRATSPRALQVLGLSRQKARYILEVADRAAAGLLEPARFDGVSDEEATTMLMDVPGVGRWTAEIALMRGLGRHDIFPAGDLGLIVAAQRALGHARRPREHEMRVLAERWKGWRTYGALYLWSSLGITA